MQTVTTTKNLVVKGILSGIVSLLFIPWSRDSFFLTTTFQPKELLKVGERWGSTRDHSQVWKVKVEKTTSSKFGGMVLLYTSSSIVLGWDSLFRDSSLESYFIFILYEGIKKEQKLSNSYIKKIAMNVFENK